MVNISVFYYIFRPYTPCSRHFSLYKIEEKGGIKMKKCMIFSFTLFLLGCVLISTNLFSIKASTLYYPSGGPGENRYNEREIRHGYYRFYENDADYQAEYLPIKQQIVNGYPTNQAHVNVYGQITRAHSSDDQKDIYVFEINQRSTVVFQLNNRNNTDTRNLHMILYNQFFPILYTNTDTYHVPLTYTHQGIDIRHKFSERRIIETNTAYVHNKQMTVILEPGIYYMELKFNSTSYANVDYLFSINLAPRAAQFNTQFSSSSIKPIQYNYTGHLYYNAVHLQIENLSQLSNKIYHTPASIRVNTSANLKTYYENIYDFQTFNDDFRLYNYNHKKLTTDHLVLYDMNQWINFQFYLWQTFIKMDAYVNQVSQISPLISFFGDLAIIGAKELIAAIPVFGHITKVLDVYEAAVPYLNTTNNLPLSDFSHTRKDYVMRNMSKFITSSLGFNAEGFDDFVNVFGLNRHAYPEIIQYNPENFTMFSNFLNSYATTMHYDEMMNELSYMLNQFYRHDRLNMAVYKEGAFYAHHVAINKQFIGTRDGFTRLVSSFSSNTILVGTSSLTGSLTNLNLAQPFNLTQSRGISYRVTRSTYKPFPSGSGGGGGECYGPGFCIVSF